MKKKKLKKNPTKSGFLKKFNLNIKRNTKLILLFWSLVVLLYFIQIIMVKFIPQYSGLIYTLSNGFAVCGALKITEEMLFPEIKTKDVLNNNPIAYAIYIFAFAYIFASAMF